MPARAARGRAAAVGGGDTVKDGRGRRRRSTSAAEAGSRGRGGWVAAGHRGRGGGRGGGGVAGRGVLPGRRVRGRAAGAPAPATAAVTRQDLSATTPVTATLGYAGSYPVTGQGGGTLTWLPPAGRVIRQGQALYRTGNGSPVVLLYGSVPDWRALDEGDDRRRTCPSSTTTWCDLGYADRADVAALGWDYYSWATAYGCSGWRGTWGSPSRRGRCRSGRWCSSRRRCGSPR